MSRDLLTYLKRAVVLLKEEIAAGDNSAETRAKLLVARFQLKKELRQKRPKKSRLAPVLEYTFDEVLGDVGLGMADAREVANGLREFLADSELLAESDVFDWVLQEKDDDFWCEGTTALHIFVAYGVHEFVARWVEAGKSLNVVGVEGQTALQIAVELLLDPESYADEEGVVDVGVVGCLKQSIQALAGHGASKKGLDWGAINENAAIKEWLVSIDVVQEPVIEISPVGTPHLAPEVAPVDAPFGKVFIGDRSAPSSGGGSCCMG